MIETDEAADPPRAVEAIEGAGEYASEGWGEYPLDSVFVRTQARTVGEVVNRIGQGRYVLDPEFQRDFVWPILKHEAH